MKPIFIALSPNAEKDDAFLALRLLFSPWRWKKFSVVQRSSAINIDKTLNQVERLETEFKKYLGVKCAFAFNSGRTALMAILHGLNLESESEILIQAFTCNALVNPIKWAGLNRDMLILRRKP